MACCGVPITAALTSASVYDNQVSVPLARLSAQRVTSLHTLMDAAYDSEALRQLERELGHVPIVAINARSREHPPTLDAAEKKRFGERTGGRAHQQSIKGQLWLWCHVGQGPRQGLVSHHVCGAGRQCGCPDALDAA